MDRVDFSNIEETSDEALQHNEEIKQLGVGKSGKNGKLKIVLDIEPSSGKTRIKEKESAFPLSVQKEMYYDQFQPKMTHVYIVSSSGGILQGDKYTINIILEKLCARVYYYPRDTFFWKNFINDTFHCKHPRSSITPRSPEKNHPSRLKLDSVADWLSK